MGAYPIDIDGDGITDLVVLRNGENVLLRGLGDCQFEPANDQWDFDGGDAYSTAFSAKWDTGASWPTIAIGNYLSPGSRMSATTALTTRSVHAGLPGGVSRHQFRCRPRGARCRCCSPTGTASGRRDLRVSNDRHYYSEYSGGQEQLWRVPASDSPSQYTEADGWQPLHIFGMGIASYDVNATATPTTT